MSIPARSLALLALCAALPAQASLDVRSLEIPRIPIHTAAPDPDGGAYGTWAAGASYKVEFLQDGVRFVPYLGAEHPRNESWRWRTVRVARGGADLLPPAALTTRRNSAFRFEYARPGWVERYDVLDQGLEQSFLFEHAPAGRGELVISGGVEGSLRAVDSPPAYEELAFADRDGVERVRYGTALAIDADGVRVPLQTSVSDGKLRIHVSDSVLESARYPLLVDPIVTVSIAQNGVTFDPDEIAHDVAYDRDGQQQMYTVARAASSVDLDLIAVMQPLGFQRPATTVFTDITSLWSIRGASLACVGSPRKYVMGFTRVFGPQSSGVRVHVRNSGNLSPSTVVYSVPRPANTFDARVSVGGTTRSSAGTHAMLVLERRDVGQLAVEGVTAVPMDVSGPVSFGAAVAIPSYGLGSGAPGLSLYQTGRPAITKQARASSSATTWLVVFQERQITGLSGTLDVYYLVGRTIEPDGTVSPTPWLSSGVSAGEHRFAPKVAGEANPNPWSYFAVGFARRPVGGPAPLGTRGASVAVEPFLWREGVSAPAPSEPLIPIPHAGAQNSVGGMSFDKRSRSHWTVTTNAGLHRLGNGGQVEQITYAVAVHNPGGIDYVDNGSYLAVSGGTPPGSPNGTLLGSVYENARPAPAMTTGQACSPATIEWTTQFGRRAPSYDQQIGHFFTQVAVSGAPSGAIHILVFGTGAQNLSLAGTPGVASGCRLLVPLSGPGSIGAELHIQSGVDARWDFPLPAFLASFTFRCQDFYLAPGGSEFVATQRLEVDLAK